MSGAAGDGVIELKKSKGFPVWGWIIILFIVLAVGILMGFLITSWHFSVPQT